MKHVHVSGHGSAEELKLVISLMRPRYFVPIHGEYRQLSQHARVAQTGDGGPRAEAAGAARARRRHHSIRRKGARIADKAPTGRVLIDVTRIGEVGDEVLRDRRHLAADGIVIAVVAIGRQNGRLIGEPELVARGFVFGEEAEASMFKDAAGVIADASSRLRWKNGPIKG